TIPADQQAALRAQVLDAIAQDVQPAYTKLAGFLRDEYAPHCRADPGVWAMPDGAARYAYRVRRETTSDLTPAQIHQIGLDEVARIEDEEAAIGKQLGFADLAALRAHLREDKSLYAKSRDDILDRYRKAIDGMKAALPKLFGRLPKEDLIVRAIE